MDGGGRGMCDVRGHQQAPVRGPARLPPAQAGTKELEPRVRSCSCTCSWPQLGQVGRPVLLLVLWVWAGSAPGCSPIPMPTAHSGSPGGTVRSLFDCPMHLNVSVPHEASILDGYAVPDRP